jgi:hypothetical protein
METISQAESFDREAAIGLLVHKKITDGYVPNSPVFKKFHNSKAKIRAIFAGNRSGKTVAGLVDMIWIALGIHPVWSEMYPPPVRLRIVTTDFDNGVRKIIVPYLREWTPRERIKIHYTDRNRQITFDNGSFIELMSNDQDVIKFGGTSRHGILFDEPPKKEIWNENQMRLVDTDGFTVLVMTPPIAGEGSGDEYWANEDIYEMDGQNGIECFNECTYNNPHLSRDIIDRIADGLSEEEKEVRLYGKFISMSGLIYKEFNQAIHVVDDFDIHDYEKEKNWTRYTGVDPHPNAPFSALYLSASPNDNLYVYDEIYETPQAIPIMAKVIKKHEGTDKINLRLADKRAGNTEYKIFNEKSIIDQLADHGLAYQNANDSFSDSFFSVKEGLRLHKCHDGKERPRLHIMRKCKNLIYQLAHYHFESSKALNEKKQVPKQKDDHLVNCLQFIMNCGPRYINYDRIRQSKLRRRETRQFAVVN